MHLGSHPPDPIVAGGAGRAADPGPRGRAQCRAWGRRGLYPECSPTAGSPPLPHCPPVLGLRPRQPGADLKVPLSSRSSGGASARCLLWDMARRDGWAQRSRVVRVWVLPLHVGQTPRGARLHCCQAPPWIAACLSPDEGQAEREGEAGPGRGRAGHTPSPPGLSAPPLPAMLRPSLFLVSPYATALGPFPVPPRRIPALPSYGPRPGWVPRASQGPAPPLRRPGPALSARPGSSQLPMLRRAWPRPSPLGPASMPVWALPSSCLRPASVPWVSPPAF